MPWVTFTAADIRDGLSVREIAIYEESAGMEFDGTNAETTGARIEAIASRTCENFRGIIRANPLVSAMGPSGTLPAFCIPWAIAIARVSLLGLSPAVEGSTNPRRDEYNDAIKGRDSLRTANVNAFAITDPEAVTASSFPAYGGRPLLQF